MKYQFKQGLSMMLVLVMLISLLSGLTITVNAKEAEEPVYNQGQRGVVATSLTSAAEDFYVANGVTYETLAKLSGSSNLSSVPSSALYKELQSLMIENHTHQTSYDETRDLYKYTDCQNGGGKISTFYSGREVGPSWDSGSTWNREHCWPKSKTSTTEKAPANSDLMSLRPANASINSGRGNTAYGQSSGYYDPNSEANGKYNVRGDAARIILYSYTRWGTYTASYMWGSDGVMESKEVLLRWMEEDPVDTWELSRNDSVESITGTRNVFVDYPELAFLLFGEEVPTGMTTPSGKASETYEITATANDSKMGTVSVSRNIITATPAAGYMVAGYEVVSGTATVTREGNNFKVTASSDCTIRIKFEVKVQVTIDYLNNATVISSQTAYSGDTITLPDYTGEIPEGYIFAGWVEETVNDTDRRPTYNKKGETYLVSGETDLYALFTYVIEDKNGPEKWSQVTSSSMLYPGAKVVFANNTYDVVAGELKQASNGYYLASVEATFSADKSAITTMPADAMIFTMGGETSKWTFENPDGELLGATAQKTLAFGSGTTTWGINISNGSATIQNGTFNNGKLLYNFQSPRFTTYSGTSDYVGTLEMYILSGGETTYYTTITGQIPPQPDLPAPDIEAVANDSTMGSVSVSDNVITAVPAEGYLVSGYEVVSGTATVTREGDTFVVDASGDCTIRIIFEAKQQPEVANRCPLCVMAEKNPLFKKHIHMRPRNP